MIFFIVFSFILYFPYFCSNLYDSLPFACFGFSLGVFFFFLVWGERLFYWFASFFLFNIGIYCHSRRVLLGCVFPCLPQTSGCCAFWLLSYSSQPPLNCSPPRSPLFINTLRHILLHFLSQIISVLTVTGADHFVLKLCFPSKHYCPKLGIRPTFPVIATTLWLWMRINFVGQKCCELGPGYQNRTRGRPESITQTTQTQHRAQGWILTVTRA